MATVAPANVHTVRETLRRIQKNLECPICLEMLSDPYSTHCGHPFCRVCIYTAISRTKVAKCPLCKEPISKRSLTENTRLADIVDAVAVLEQAVIEDTGIPRTPPRPVPHSHEGTGTPGLLLHSLLHPTPVKPQPHPHGGGRPCVEEGGDDGGGGGESAHCESEERTSASVAATGARRKRKLFTQPSSLSSRDPQPGAATSTRPSPSPSPSPPLTHKRKCRTRFPCSSSSKGKCPLRKAKKKKTLSAQEEPADSATAALLQALEEAALGLPGTQLDGIPGCSDRGNHMRSRLRPPQAKKSRRDSAAITSCEGAQVTRTAPSIGGQVDMDTSEKRTECISSANTEVSSSQTTRDLLAEDTKHPPVHKPPQTLRLAVGARKPAKDVEESLGMQLECAATAVIEETPRLEIGRRTCGRMVAGGDRSTISKSVRIAPRRDGLASAVDVRVIQETPFIRISRTGSASGEGETEPLVVSIPVSCFKRGQKMTRECVEETPLVRAVNEVGGGAGGVDVLLAAEEVEPGGQVCAEQREEEEGFQNGSSSEGEVLSGSQHGSSSDSDRTPLLPRSPPAHCDPNLLTPVAASSRTHRATGSLSGHIPLDSSGSTTPDLCMPSPPSPSPPSSSPSISPSLFISRQNPSNALPRRFSFNPSVEQQPAVAPSNPTPHLDTSFSPCVPLQNTHHNATARCTVGDGDRSRYLTPDFLCSKVAETQLGTQSSCVNSSQNSPENRPRALLLGLPTLHALRVEKHTSPPVFTTKFFSNERQSPDLSGPGTGNVSSREDIETETRCEEKEEEEERMRTEEIAPPAQPPLRPAATEEGALSVQLSLAVGAPASSPLSQPPSTVPGSVSVVPDSLCPNDTSQTGDCCADIHDTVRTPLLRGQPPAQVNSDLCVSPHNQTRGCLSCTDECLTPTCTLTLTATETGRVTCGDVSQYYSSSSSGVSLSGGLTMTSQDLDALKLQMEQKQSEIAELEALLVREKAADESPDRGRMTPEEGLPLLALTGQAMLCCNTTADGREASLEECPPNYPNCGSEAEEDIFEVIRQSQHEVMVIPESLPNHTPFSSPDHIYFSTGNHTPLLQKPGSGGAVELVEDSAVVNAAALEEVKPEELSETIAHHSAVPIRAPPPRVAAAAPEPHVPPTETTDDSRWKSARKTKTTSTATSTASNVSVSRQRNGNPNSHHRNRDLALMKKSSRSSDEKKKFLCELSPGQNAMLPPTPDGDSVSPALLQMADRLIRSLRSPPLVITDRQTCIDIDRDLISSTGTRLSRSVQQRTAWKQNPRGSNKKGKCGAEENVSVQESENGDVNKRIQLMKPSNTTATRSSGSVQQGPLKSPVKCQLQFKAVSNSRTLSPKPTNRCSLPPPLSPSPRLSLPPPSSCRSGMKTRPLSLLASSLSNAELRQAKLLAQSHSGRLASCINGSTTHLIVNTDQNSCCPRTLKYLQALVSGTWIVSYEWVSNSLKAGKLLPEHVYEVRGDHMVCSGAPCTARTTRAGQVRGGDHMVCSGAPCTAHTTRAGQRVGLFSGYQFILQDESPLVSNASLSQLIRLAGGMIVGSADEGLAPNTVVVSNRKAPVTGGCGLYPVATSSWILGCISEYRLLDLE